MAHPGPKNPLPLHQGETAIPSREDEAAGALTDDPSPPRAGAVLRAFFRSRELADAACARVNAEDSRLDARVGVPDLEGDAYVVSVTAPDAASAAAARAALNQGAERMEEGPADAAREPREVQPGFTDAPPGVVPEAADFPAERYEGAGGRFAKQLDDAPDTPDPDREK